MKFLFDVPLAVSVPARAGAACADPPEQFPFALAYEARSTLLAQQVLRGFGRSAYADQVLGHRPSEIRRAAFGGEP